MKLLESQLDAITYSDLSFISAAIQDRDSRQVLNSWKAAAFGAFLQGAGTGGTFETYLQNIGLGDKTDITPEQRANLARIALYKANKIKEADQCAKYSNSSVPLPLME